MEPNSLDWIWEDIDSTHPADVVDEFDEINDLDLTDRTGHDDESHDDSASGSSVSCSMLVGDKRTAEELNEIVLDVQKRYGQGDEFVGDTEPEVEEEEEENKEDEKRDEGLLTTDDYDPEGAVPRQNRDKFYIDALEAVKNQLSEVQLVWSDTLYQCTVNGKNVPESYTKTTNVEKLILLYADNFIKQFQVKFPNRRQLLLVHENECGVQKCISTTIKPSRLVYHDLNDLTSYSKFVAKHISYAKLEDPLLLPKKIVSPTTVLQMQTANCFELATLLASFLIGSGYDAFVVQGYASESVCNNDLRKVKLDLPKDKSKDEESSEYEEDLDDYYTVEPMIDLCSEYVKMLMEEEKNKNAVKDVLKKSDLEECYDSLYGKRVHCWVLILSSKNEDEHSSKNLNFIEPSTGEQIDISNENYIGIEAVWNHTNYWVNIQPLGGGCAQYDFTLTNPKYWEHFLPDESQSLREVTSDSKLNENEIPRHVFMPNSWVSVLEVPREKYLMLYPTGKKVVRYLNALKEFYADYVMPDGLIERTSYYAEPEYTTKSFVKEFYKHRTDKLIGIEIRYTDETVETEEYFTDGRKDCLKVHKFTGNSNNIETKRLIKFYDVRSDSLIELKIDRNSFIALFKDRSDLLFLRTCIFSETEESYTKNSKTNKRSPVSIVENYLRDETKHKDRDIATTEFNFVTNTIYVQYQYGDGQITQSSRQFNKPSVSGGDEFDPESVVENIVYPYEGHLKAHEAYLLLQDMIKAENEALRDVSLLEDNVITLLETRSRERSEFKLKIDSMDWDRNHKIRKLLQNEKDKKLAIAKRDKAKHIEYTLPYFETTKRPFTHDTALMVRDKIIKNFRYSTKYQFIRTKKLFTKEQFKLQCMMKAVEYDSFDSFEQKNKLKMLCSTLKNELDVLVAKMERLKEKRVERYNNLALYLNTNPDFKMLPPLKLCNLNVVNKPAET